jgi:molybdopterin molybdotransferase
LNIRFKGEDIKSGVLLLKKSDLVKPQTIGLLCALGIEKIKVYKMPSVKIIATGDELVEPGQSLKFGQVYHLMGPMLKAQSQKLGILQLDYELVGDDQEAIRRALSTSFDRDIILVTGGISLGEYDLVKPALLSLGVKEVFHTGFWRPGKPLFFGIKDKTRIFALPGNPVSAFTCFHIFVKALIYKSLGKIYKPKSAILLNDFIKPAGFTFFAPARIKQGLTILQAGSHRIFGLNNANGLSILPKECVIVKAHELVKYYPI